MTEEAKYYYKALQALKEKDFRLADRYFKSAENQIAENMEFSILSEATRLLMVVKNEIAELEGETVLG